MKRQFSRCPASASAGGFTLIEMVIVVAIIAALLAIATLNFNNWTKKTNIEAQVRQMLADLEQVRMYAIQSKKQHSVVLNPNGYVFLRYSSANDPGKQVLSQTLHYPIQQLTGGAYSAFSNTTLTFNSRGYLIAPAPPLTIAVAPGVGSPAVNCLTLQDMKGNIGVIQGGSCVFQ